MICFVDCQPRPVGFELEGEVGGKKQPSRSVTEQKA